MKWKELFQRQRELDRFIEQKHQLEKADLIPRKILAFQVELGELANETRCFKFWSLKPSASRKVILEEYVDGLHFLLSLGLELDCRLEELKPDSLEGSLWDQFQKTYRLTSRFEQDRSPENYRRLFSGFLTLGLYLELTEEEVMNAYWEKNCINHQRQQQDY